MLKEYKVKMLGKYEVDEEIANRANSRTIKLLDLLYKHQMEEAK